MKKEIQFFDPKLVTEEKLVTTKELASILGVSERTIKDAAKNKGVESTLIPLKTNGGIQKVIHYNEKQATIIKQEIQKHHNLASRQIDNVSTDYEMELMTQKVLEYHIQKANEYKQRAEIAEGVIKRISEAKGCFSMNNTAKALKLPYGNKTLFQKLKQMNILNADNSPRQRHINAGHFKVIVKEIPNVGNKAVTVTTGKGLVFLAKLFNTEIDKSIMPDESN